MRSVNIARATKPAPLANRLINLCSQAAGDLRTPRIRLRCRRTLESGSTVEAESQGKEVIRVATAAKPTNEHITDMLTQVLRELGQVQKNQNQLAADLRRLAPKGTK